MRWRRVALKDVGEIIGGGTPPTKEPANFGDEYSWITPKDLSRQKSRFVEQGERSLSKVGLANSSAKLLPAGTIVISSRAPIGLTSIARVPLATNQGCRNFIPSDEVDSLFMYYKLGSMAEEFERRANGSTFKEISGSTLRDIEIDLPSVLEQRAIAVTLGALDDKIESNRRAMENLDQLYDAIWQREYDKVSPEAEMPLSSIVTTQYGLTASASSEADGEKFLRVTDINKQHWIDWTSVPYVSTDEMSKSKYALSKGDLLVARMADPGKAAIYDGGPSSVFASYLVRLKASSYEEALFIYGFLKSAHYAEYSAGAMSGSVQKNMNAKVIVGARIKGLPQTLSLVLQGGRRHCVKSWDNSC
ncbi:restriction endonuclease subunit S [Auritidibacter ignavus]|uniref:restriction endonuclease subunit S n=1 Tax=Auritidibacter ignavus TaxID=678932 RepID=UPI0024BBBDA9|nr:restriction endonuclease subunit S [Auritidibacter ignavus]WHS35817.1 restriction endonuclease subunit S [Auritidibacter ignavus]